MTGGSDLNWLNIPDIILMVRGEADTPLTKDNIRKFMDELPKIADMIPLDETVIVSGMDVHYPGGKTGGSDLIGHCAFRPWRTSGVTLYTWKEMKMITTIIHTCKAIKVDKVLDFVIGFWGLKAYQHRYVDLSKEYIYKN